MSSGSPPSAFEVPYDSFRKECDSSVVDTNDISSSANVMEEVKSKELDYDFICFFLSYQRVDLYRSIDWRCEDMNLLILCINFAKRQLTWFRNEHIYHWLDASKPLDIVLNFICDAYHDKSGNWVVPESLQMKKELSNRREVSELKSNRTKNRHFIRHEDCSDILDWIHAENTRLKQ
ncbi:putative tRNA dimethylallyltransferase [Rosa chinensis]|uniref:Putative tRNA dimethylallyltransferase n=1 Tax=Rosa chinensis TaxID=74649 RepID=A0A2P6PRF9_ROSCH|nr:putative tRNA dimethylallyltransferase [Rosa chinensis]